MVRVYNPDTQEAEARSQSAEWHTSYIESRDFIVVIVNFFTNEESLTLAETAWELNPGGLLRGLAQRRPLSSALSCTADKPLSEGGAMGCSEWDWEWGSSACVVLVLLPA